LRPGDRGFCFVRENRDGQMLLTTYGKSTGFCIDPIEKKPLNHFYPGTSVLSFGTAGCNLACKFCQNWSISKSKEIERLSESATPEAIATAARKLGCRSVAFTYNDPVIWAEYAIDTARACREQGIQTVAVTAGYITPAARGPFFAAMDAANVDLKGFSEEFYQHFTLSHLAPVLETLRWLKQETDVWFEITNLIIPQANDSRAEIQQMCDWILEHVGPDVPVHFTAFHPDFRLRDRSHTPPQMLHEAYELARRAGLHYVYAGNIHSPREQTTYCPACQRPVIERDGYTLGRYDLNENRCRHCGATIAGHFDRAPGDWGSRREPVRIADYATSSDANSGDAARSAVAQIPERKEQPTMTLTQIQSPPSDAISSYSPAQEEAIVRAAGQLVAAATKGEPLQLSGDLAGAAQRKLLGAFVSLKRRGRLRSCCGFLGKSVPLEAAIAHAAQRAAHDDHRFPTLDASELAYLDIEVWLLENMQPVAARGAARREAFRIGQHGLQIARGEHRGLLLPGVAIEHELDNEQFLEHVAMKAHLPPTAWREDDTQLWTFEGHAIRRPLGELLTAPLIASPAASPATKLPLAQADVSGLAEYCRGNILAMVRGATPRYFVPGLADANVNGMLLSAKLPGDPGQLQVLRLSLRELLPLQSTLFTLAQNIAETLQSRGLPGERLDERLVDLAVNLAVFSSPAMQGTVAEPDLRGVDAKTRSLTITERNKSALVFSANESLASQLASAAKLACVQTPTHAAVYSLATISTSPTVQVANVPSAATGPTIRAAAQAGRFYPADARELGRLVDRCLEGPAVQPRSVPAVMAPHAGLIYSGRIAGEVFRRVQFPRTIVVIGPKHTRLGVEWAVAPHATWSIPGFNIAADPLFARRLCEAIPGLELDAAAHAEEHAIEVELPLLARLAPESRVVGIAIGGGDLGRCRQFAAGLAGFIQQLPEPPLLVISSDMNHFASDGENRRLDEIALAAMETLDPATLYEKVTRQNISMCGLLPAVIVMETLRQLGRLTGVERVGYTTSAEVSGDTSRVVGYAGVLFR
jgi:AmmeMemoRadiSam system radical SAM enzyme/AmmeMemoRadiSam system protein B/AmmeMemoRadiSam system protein A